MNDYKIVKMSKNGKWHIIVPRKKSTYCGKAITAEHERSMHLGTPTCKACKGVYALRNQP